MGSLDPNHQNNTYVRISKTNHTAEKRTVTSNRDHCSDSSRVFLVGFNLCRFAAFRPDTPGPHIIENAGFIYVVDVLGRVVAVGVPKPRAKLVSCRKQSFTGNLSGILKILR